MRSLNTTAGRVSRLCLLGLPLLAVAPLAQAQNFETYYGERPARDGSEDVKSVRYCPNKGSILVGTRVNGSNGVIEVLATRVDDNGVAIWQRAYNIAGSKNSTANAVAELRSGAGFVLTGAVQPTSTVADTFLYVLHVNCDGKVLWTRLLANQGTGSRAVGFDIVESTGPVIGPVAQTELIVVGDENMPAPAGAIHGRIARITSLGGLVFNFAYSQPANPQGIRFRAVTENRSSSSNLADIVVAGSAAWSTNWVNDRRALLFRTRSNGAPLCNVAMGATDSSSDDYYGITALAANNFAGESVLVGASRANTAAPLVYLTRFSAGGCAPLVQSQWRDTTDGATAFDVVESPLLTTGLAPSIVATGTIAGATVQGDGFALTAQDGNLGPLGAQFRYSTQSTRRETLLAIDNKGTRFVMSGSTFSDWDGVGDGQDFYFVQTDPNKKTQCVREWDHTWSPAQLPRVEFTPPVKSMPSIKEAQTPEFDAFDQGYCCQFDPG
ncbi:hypothetical protein DFR29_104191 [Tahibacter aquaticus]|uniref:Uncharacterized protein n=1 Tax=Tahibacter aquaticus TaxID=520092 RepID=A0A4R6Z2F2_9GAMM|nr:hypothetical protein [Tahibacter aquaticus]TDR45763.1 hypothetical protein DFR29_104191 [Tahibacter aquaticus]